ncbi:MAG: hypothetical protein ACREQR_10040 [Candidatus Binataceae bacterium]
MRTRKIDVSRNRDRGLRIIAAAALAASLGVFAFGGCSSQNADQPPAQPIQVNFALNKCQQLEPNLYKCPAIDKPICTPEFNRGDVNCVRIGPKGSVFIQRGGMNP